MWEYKGIYKMSSTKSANELQKENSRDEQGAWKDRASDGQRWSMLLLRIFNKQPWESTSSKLRDLDMQIHESQNSPTSGVVNAKWRAGTSTRVSINSNQKSMN